MNKYREWVIPLHTLIINDGTGLSNWQKRGRENETYVVELAALKAERDYSTRLLNKLKYLRDALKYPESSELSKFIAEYESWRD